MSEQAAPTAGSTSARTWPPTTPRHRRPTGGDGHLHPRRPRGHRAQGRDAHRRRRAGRHLHPPVLLPPADEVGRACAGCAWSRSAARAAPPCSPAATSRCRPGPRWSPTPTRSRRPRTGSSSSCSINHPLDCPVCDKGGECPLQDQTLAYGPGESRFVEEKRHFEKPIPISELVLLDRERCIQCSRCTRFADEVAGEAQIDFIGRGELLEVNTFPELPFTSYFSGNTVQICPVGALTATPYRFAARPWDLDQVESTCTTCAVGCRVAVQSSSNRVTRLLGHRRRPGQPRLAVRQGPVRLRCGQQRRPPDRAAHPQGRARWCRPPGTRRWPRWPTGWRKATDDGRGRGGRRDRRGPADQRRGLRLGQAGQGGARHRLGRRPAGRRPARRGGRRPAPGHHRPGGGGRHGDRPDRRRPRGAPGPLPPPALGHRGRRPVGGRAVPPGHLAHPVRRRLAALRPRRGHRPWPGPWSTPALRGPRRRRSRRARPRPAGWPGRATWWSSWPDGPRWPRTAPWWPRPLQALAGALPGARFLSALRRGNVNGALDMGLAPGSPARPGRPSTRARTGSPGPGVRSRRPGAGTPRASCTPRPAIPTPGPASARWSSSAPTRCPTSPTAGWPSGPSTAPSSWWRWPRRPARSPSAPTWCCRRRRPTSGPGPPPTSKGRVSRLGQKLVPPGQAWPDWMIAAELAVHLGADLGLDSVGDVWDEIERLAPAYRGITRAVLDALGTDDGVLAPLTASPVSHRPARRPARPDRLPRGRVGGTAGGPTPGRPGRAAHRRPRRPPRRTPRTRR